MTNLRLLIVLELALLVIGIVGIVLLMVSAITVTDFAIALLAITALGGKLIAFLLAFRQR